MPTAKKKKTPLVKSTSKLKFETSFCYLREIKNCVEMYKDGLQKELDVIEKHLPESESYYTMSSRLADASAVYKELEDFLFPYDMEYIKRLADD